MFQMDGETRIPMRGGDLVVNSGVMVRAPRGFAVAAVSSSTQVAVFSRGGGGGWVAVQESGPHRRIVGNYNSGKTGDGSSVLDESDAEAIRRARIASLDRGATFDDKDEVEELYTGLGKGDRAEPIVLD